MLYEAIIIGIIVGLLTKGKLNNLAKLEIKNVYIVFLAFFMKYGLDFAATRGYVPPSTLVMLCQAGTYVLLFMFLYSNRTIPGFPLIFIGMLLNFIVIMANSGTMPASLAGMPQDIVSDIQNQRIPTYSEVTEHTKFYWFADIWLQKFPVPKKFSIGDVFISIGVFYTVFASMRLKDTKTYRMDSFINRQSV